MSMAFSDILFNFLSHKHLHPPFVPPFKSNFAQKHDVLILFVNMNNEQYDAAGWPDGADKGSY